MADQAEKTSSRPFPVWPSQPVGFGPTGATTTGVEAQPASHKLAQIPNMT